MQDKNSVVILVFNDLGELALQKRAAHDDSYPSHWDFSAAGGIELNEEIEVAAKRELKEELGIEAEIEYITEVLYENEAGRDQLYIFKAKHNGLFIPDPSEVEEARFFTIVNIDKMLEAGEKFHPEFCLVWEKGIKPSTKQ